MNGKIIVLDIDGVLNGTLLPMTGSNLPDVIPELVGRLNQVVEATGARIVMSTSWRTRLTLEEWQNFFDENGIKAIVVGVTPSFRNFRTAREDEIEIYIHQHRIKNFVILDDIPMVRLKDHAVETDHNYGLSQADVEKAIKILNGNK